ncbi:hypothetical protein ACOSQ4_012315 [Xanthoceras sorbifolium]
MKSCELCDSPAKIYCESDQASLCWDCDTRVHGANFLVAKHTRTLLCHVCQAPTPWNGSGPKLGPTISACNVCCVGTNSSCTRREQRNNGETHNDQDDDLDEEHDHDDNSGDDGGDGDEEEEEEEEEDGDDDEEEEENQVVPWTCTPPPPVLSSSTSIEEGSSKLCNGEDGTSASNRTFSMRETTITKFGSQDHQQGYCYYSSSSASQQHKNMYWSSHESAFDYR